MVDKKYKKSNDIVCRKIAGEMILVPVRKKTADLDNLYTLNNEVALRVWELLDGKNSFLYIRDSIAREFEVEAEQAGADLEEFLKQIESFKIIERV